MHDIIISRSGVVEGHDDPGRVDAQAQHGQHDCNDEGERRAQGGVPEEHLLRAPQEGKRPVAQIRDVRVPYRGRRVQDIRNDARDE